VPCFQPHKEKNKKQLECNSMNRAKTYPSVFIAKTKTTPEKRKKSQLFNIEIMRYLT
jgi:hypothetical protein